MTNPKDRQLEFAVTLSDENLFGEKRFFLPASGSAPYEVVVSPLKATKQNSSVVFYNDDAGEFWYALKIEAVEAPPAVLAPLSSPIGKYASTSVVLDNPLDKPVTFRLENDNQTAFHVVAKRVLQLAPREKRRVEIRYIPTTVGVRESANIVFTSPEVGDWVFQLSGTARPPQALSSIVLFLNPFSYPARFSISLSSDDGGDVFKLLIRRRVFIVHTFGEEFHIPVSFAPHALGQYSANIVVSFLGPARGPMPGLDALPTITWVFPVIGSCVATGTVDSKMINCRAHELYEDEFLFTLIGEREIFEPSDYAVVVTFPPGFEFVHSIFDGIPSTLRRQERAVDLFVKVRLRPQRPLRIEGQITIKNPVGQEWAFELSIVSEPGKTQGSIVLESLLHKSGTVQVLAPNVIRASSAFHAYFVRGSAVEFSVTPQYGFIDTSGFPLGAEKVNLPIAVVFAPQMYGKVLKGTLVIDTLECQLLFDVCGKTPDYVPPVVPPGSAASRLDNMPSHDDTHRMQPKKRNIIKENIENAKIARPVLSLQRLKK
jgi:hypothetical protein